MSLSTTILPPLPDIHSIAKQKKDFVFNARQLFLTSTVPSYLSLFLPFLPSFLPSSFFFSLPSSSFSFPPSSFSFVFYLSFLYTSQLFYPYCLYIVISFTLIHLPDCYIDHQPPSFFLPFFIVTLSTRCNLFLCHCTTLDFSVLLLVYNKHSYIHLL